MSSWGLRIAIVLLTLLSISVIHFNFWKQVVPFCICQEQLCLAEGFLTSLSVRRTDLNVLYEPSEQLPHFVPRNVLKKFPPQAFVSLSVSASNLEYVRRDLEAKERTGTKDWKSECERGWLIGLLSAKEKKILRKQN